LIDLLIPLPPFLKPDLHAMKKRARTKNNLTSAMDEDLLIGWPLEGADKSKRKFPKRRGKEKYSDLAGTVRFKSDRHLITFAPTRSGKGVSSIIPNLLHYNGPIITIDPKGENFSITANYRKNVLGQRIILLDPFESVKDEVIENAGVNRASLNPLDLVTEFGTHEEIQISMIASIMCSANSSARSGDDFWNQEAQKLVTGIIGATVASAKKNGERADFQSFIDRFFQDDLVYKLAVILDQMGISIGDFAYKALAAFLQKADKERSGVVSTAQSFLTPFISKELNRYLATSTLSLKELSNKDDYTVYIVIPPSKLVSHSNLLRLWVATMMNSIMERGESPLKRTLFLLDECAQLGELEELRKAVTLLAGYGLQVWMFFQDVAQVRTLYDEDFYTLLHNCGVTQAFGVDHATSAMELTRIFGRYRPKDIMNMDASQQLVLIAGREPQMIKKMEYFSDGAFSGRFEINPFANSESRPERKNSFPTNFIYPGA